MPKNKDDDREERIAMEIVVDAYGEIERAISWYYYLKDNLAFPFKAECITERASSPLDKGEKVEVVGMPPEDECENEMFVNIKWKKRTLAVPLSQLTGIKVDDETQQGIEDWHYWVEKGYEF
jgi:hypothetical protein